MANEDNNIQIKIRTSAEQAASKLRDLASAFGASGRSASGASKNYSSWGKQLDKMNSKIANINKDANRSSKGFDSMSKSLFGLGNAMQFLNLYALADGIAKTIQASVDAIETLNMFTLAMGNSSKETQNLLKNFTNLTGLNLSKMENAAGTYSLLARSMGMSADKAKELGVSASKLSVDLASAFNVSTTQAMQDIRSGLVGQTETMYKYGADLTEASLKQEALNQGLTKSVRNMSQAEKMALRYSVMLQHTGIVQGDFARTIGSPANQLKILSERFLTLQQNIGNVFQPVLIAILPYLNAIAIILAEWAQSLAILLGYDPSMNKINDKIAQMSENFRNSGDDVDDVTDAVKDLKNATLGLDELNVLTTKDTSQDENVLDKIKFPDLKEDTADLQKYNDKVKELVEKLRPLMDMLKTIAEIAAAGLLLKKIIDLVKWVKSLTKAFDKKNKSLAEQTKRTKEDTKRVKELSEELKKLAPIATAAGLALGGLKLPNLGGVFGGLPEIGVVLDGLAGKFGALGESVSAVLGYLGELPEALGLSVSEGIIIPFANPLPQLEAIVGTVNAFFQANPFAIPEISFPISDPIGALQSVFVNVSGVLNGFVTSVNGSLAALSMTFNTVFGEIYTVMSSSLGDALITASSFVSQLVSSVSTGISSLSLDVSSILSTMAMNVGMTFSGMNSSVSLALSSILSSVNTIFSSMTSSVSIAIETLVNGVITGISTMVSTIPNLVSSMSSSVLSYLSTMTSSAQSYISSMGTSIVSSLSSAMSSAASTVSSFAGNVSSIFSSIVSTISSAMSTLGSTIPSVISAAVQAGIQAFSSLIEIIQNFASDTMSSLVDGVSNAFSEITSFIQDHAFEILAAIALLIAAFIALNAIIAAGGIAAIGGGIATAAATVGSVAAVGVGAFATGGFPTSGQLFVANESGAEMVGSMDGKTAVANNQQIVEGIRSGVYDAVVSAMSQQQQQPLVVNLDGEVIYTNQQKVANNRGNNFGLGAFAR